MTRFIARLNLILALTLALSACAPKTLSETTLESHLLIARTQCGTTHAEPRISLIENETALASAYQDLFRHQVGASVTPPAIDLQAHRVVMIEMGQRPTAGYALLPADPLVHLTDATVGIQLIWKEPAPGAMVAQVLTSPCLLVEIPRDGYEQIEILDQSGQVRAELAVPE